MQRPGESEREEEADVRAAVPAIDDTLIRGAADEQARLVDHFGQMTDADKRAAIVAREQAAFEKALADIAKFEREHVSESNALPAAAALTEAESAARRAAQLQAEEDFQRVLAQSLADARPVSIVQTAPQSNQDQNENKHSDESDILAARRAAQLQAEEDLQRALTESFEAAQALERPVSMIFSAASSVQPRRFEATSSTSFVAAQKPAEEETKVKSEEAVPKTVAPVKAKAGESEAAREARKKRAEAYDVRVRAANDKSLLEKQRH